MVNGIVNIYKEKGYTSFDVVAKLRGIFHQKKIGHTGTLDPDAEGVLPVCLGNATKVCELLTDRDKEYEAVLLLGQETDTQDGSGTVLHTADVDATEEEVRECIRGFIGSYDQIPPMYSALKINGQKLCDLARKGVTVERKARTVTIYDIQILAVELPRVRMRVSCSKGTYIRTLCHDIGEKLGCHGCMESLLRTKAAGFCLEDAIKLDELKERVDALTAQNGQASGMRQNEEVDGIRKNESMHVVEWNRSMFREIVKPIDSVFSQYLKVVASRRAQKMIINGNRIPTDLLREPFSAEDQALLRLYDEDENFIGIYSFSKTERQLIPVKRFMESL